MRLGAWLVYASPSDLEGECVTVAGVRRMVARLQRLGFSPSVKRHAWTAAGHTNVACDLEGAVLPAPVAPPPVALEPELPPAAPPYVEVRREQWPDGSATVLSFAVRVF